MNDHRGAEIPKWIRAAGDWRSIDTAIPGDKKLKFLRQTAGTHGSRALSDKTSDSADYWKAVTTLLGQLP
ncbi:MAG: hypothetical protein ACR2NM_08795 [Bythopirellula sp.]